MGECGTSKGRRVTGDSGPVDAAKSFTKMQLGADFSQHPPVLVRGGTLVCDAKCAQLLEAAKRIERNLTMAAALGITDADASDNVRESYSDELIRDARRRPQLVAMLESTFAEFIRDPSAKRRALPVMKADDRRVAHTLAGKPPAIPPLTAHYRAALDARCVAVHHAACPPTSMPATPLHVHHAHRAATF